MPGPIPAPPAATNHPQAPAGGAPDCDLEVTILMPCLDEAETIVGCIRQASRFLETHRIAGEVLIADNGSRDGSIELAQRAGARVVPVARRGYGSALAGGIEAARGRFIIMGDADGSYDFSALMPFIEALRGGAELVMGNRFRGGIAPGAMPALNRFLGNPVLTGIGRLFFASPAGDFHCGLRGFDRDAIRRLDLQTTGMEFASEMVVKATLLGLRTQEVPTTLAPDGRSRPPHLRRWRDGWRHLRFMLLYCPRWLFLLPGCALMGGGLALGLWLLPGPRQFGSITLDIHTLLYAALAILIGFQAILFALFTRTFGVLTGLLPSHRFVSPWLRPGALELGLVLGLTLVAAGALGTVVAVNQWSHVDFGPLEPTRTFRTIIPAVLAMALGGQIVLGSFFLSVLGLGRRDSRSP